MKSPTLQGLEFVVSADWSKDESKRSVHVADVRARTITEQHGKWSLAALLEEARRLSDGGRHRVLIAMDLAIGVPAGFWEAVKADPRWAGCRSFLDWLARVGVEPGFFEPVADPQQWALDRPFFRVQAGEGGRARFEARVDGGMRRKIDQATQANPIFAVSGIPGSVGSATACLWRELAPLLNQPRDFAVWPFNSEERSITLVESYPGLAYAAAIAERLPEARLRVSKTTADERNRFCGQFEAAAWVTQHQAHVGDLTEARGNEDVFDSLVTAAAILRCILEARPLCADEWVDAEAEGTMVLAGPVDPGARAERLQAEPPANARRPGGARRQPAATAHPCPIPGCVKVFEGGRSGWDPHVASLNRHPNWHPEIAEGEKRKAQFRLEFPEWFD